MPVRDLRSTMDEGIPNNFVWRISDSHYGVPSADSGISLAASHGAIYRDQTVPRTIYQRAYYQHYRHQAVFIPDRIELREYIPQGGSQSPSWTNLSHTLFVRPNAVALAPLRNELPPFTYSFCWVNNSLSEIPAWEASSSVTNTTLLQNLPPPFTYPLNSTSISTSSMPAVEASSNFTDQSLPKTALETTLSSGPPSSTWISVPDPVALAGLIERPGLAGAPAYPKIVGFEGRILHQLFEFLDPCAATCLGLTCRKLYQHYKFEYPEKISLYERSASITDPYGVAELTLGDLMATWIGPFYRRRIWRTNSVQIQDDQLPPQFLRREIYGASPGNVEEVALAKRYIEYQSFHRLIGNRTLYLLPHPFDLSDSEWNAQAKECILKDAKDFRGRGGAWTWNKWMSFWVSSEVFANISYMDKLKVLQWFEEQSWRASMMVFPGPRLLRTPSTVERLWWFAKRNIRYLTWWVGSLPPREPYPSPAPDQRGSYTHTPSPANSVILARRYTYA